MAKNFLVLLIGFFILLPFAGVSASTLNPDQLASFPGATVTSENAFGSNPASILELTPRKYKELTGKKMSFKEIIQLKAAQKLVKKNMGKAPGDVPQVVYIILAFFGLAWIIMGIKDEWSGNNWWINLLLSFLFIIPGLIHALVVMNQYY